MTSHKPLFATGVAARLGSIEAPCAVRSRPYVLAATILASAMGFIDGTIVQIALAAMQGEFGVDFATLQWIVNGYALTMSALIVTGGALGDRLGRRRIFLAGIGLFTLASIACAIAPSAGWLVAARVVQGGGAALMIPQSLAILSASFPRSVRGRAIGIWSAASAVTTAIGPALGGILVDVLTWRAAFWINVPLALAAAFLTGWHVPESRNEAATGPLDLVGAAVITVALAGITIGMTLWPVAGLSASTVWGPLLVGIAVLLPFWRHEQRAASPIMPPDLFDRTFIGLNLVTLALYFTLAGLLFLLPYHLISIAGLSAATAGLVMLPFGLIIGLGSRYVGSLSDRRGRRPFLVAGPLVVAAGCLVLARAAGWEGPAGALAGVVAVACGMTLVVSPLTTAVMNAAAESRIGAASGVNNAIARIAGLLAVALVGAIAVQVFAGELGPALEARDATTETIRMMLDQAIRLAGVDMAGLPAEQAALAREAVAEAFVAAYRFALGFCAAIAILASAIALCLGPTIED